MEKGDTIGFLSKSQEASKYFEMYVCPQSCIVISFTTANIPSFSEVPWVLDLLSLVPGIGYTNPMNVPEAYARQFILNRANHTCSDHNDLASYLVCCLYICCNVSLTGIIIAWRERADG